jgi:two-component system, LytTR family, sensor kinase
LQLILLFVEGEIVNLMHESTGSTEARSGWNWWRILLVVAVVWTLFGLLAASQMYANTADERTSYPLIRVLRLTLQNAWLLGALTVPTVFLLNLAAARIRQKKLRIVAYVALLPIFTLAHVIIRPFVVPIAIMGGSPGQKYTHWELITIALRSFYVGDTWMYCCIVFAFLAWRFAEETRLRALREERLQTKLARAELQVLKMQLQPHFLFNTLNTIYHLAPQNSRKAQAMIARLAELLRLSLDHVSSNTVPLQRELEFLNSYLEIEKARFEERLTILMDIAPDANEALVPNMLLQPLVENAIRHGVSKKAAGGTITIAANRVDKRLQLSITDDGRLSVKTGGGGIGLSNTRARLTQLYGEDFRFELTPTAEGTRVELDLPLQLATESVEATEVL